MHRMAAAIAVLLIVTTGCTSDPGPGQEAAAAGCQAVGSLTPQPGLADLTSEPHLPPRFTPAPCDLVISDVVVGSGAVAKAKDKVALRYVTALLDTAEVLDSSWTGGDGVTVLSLGEGQLIKGFDQGVAGMRVGGRRVLVIPSSLAYGEEGAGVVPPNAVLTFVIDLVASGLKTKRPGQ